MLIAVFSKGANAKWNINLNSMVLLDQTTDPKVRAITFVKKCVPV